MSNDGDPTRRALYTKRPDNFDELVELVSSARPSLASRHQQYLMKTMTLPSDYDLRPCNLDVIRTLCEEHHGYGSAGNTITYGFAVFEEGRAVAVYAWQPPARGAAVAVSPGEPSGALMLSRMAAVPREERRLNHVSRPLRRQKDRLIDRGRWPVLVTWSDEGQGHCGNVYKCSGWTPTEKNERPFYLTTDGRRVSSYTCGEHNTKGLVRGGYTWIQRWEHHACDIGKEAEYMANAGWFRAPIIGKTWRSGNQAYEWMHESELC